MTRIFTSSKNVSGYLQQCRSSRVSGVSVSLYSSDPLQNGVKPFYFVFEGKTPQGTILTHIDYAGEFDQTFRCAYTSQGQFYDGQKAFDKAIAQTVAQSLRGFPLAQSGSNLDETVKDEINRRAAALPVQTPEQLAARYLSTLSI